MARLIAPWIERTVSCAPRRFRTRAGSRVLDVARSGDRLHSIYGSDARRGFPPGGPRQARACSLSDGAGVMLRASVALGSWAPTRLEEDVRVMGQTRSTAAVPRRRREVRVWAAGSNAPLRVCEDARLRGGSEWKDATYGQAGWDWGVNFQNFTDLTNKLQGSTPNTLCGNLFFDCDSLRDGELLELAINCHGGRGIVDIDCTETSSEMFIAPKDSKKSDGQTEPPDLYLDIGRLSVYQSQFDVLKRLLAPDHGVLFFMCCVTGQLQAGTDFLCAVSKLLPDRDVMAIATIGYSSGGLMNRSGEGGGEPGMRDTAEISAAPTRELEDARYKDLWNDLSALPWASRTSPHTKIARNGSIVGGAGRNF